VYCTEGSIVWKPAANVGRHRRRHRRRQARSMEWREPIVGSVEVEVKLVDRQGKQVTLALGRGVGAAEEGETKRRHRVSR